MACQMSQRICGFTLMRSCKKVSLPQWCWIRFTSYSNHPAKPLESPISESWHSCCNLLLVRAKEGLVIELSGSRGVLAPFFAYFLFSRILLLLLQPISLPLPLIGLCTFGCHLNAS